MTGISDQVIRQQALDVSQSFIVQAPAGSGKTELLIQRYLKLLTIVESKPEEILAITFTRKAAAEMKHRVLHALAQATQPEPETVHAKQTWQLARAVMQRDQQLGWQLQANPHRLVITTIDAFCAKLAKQLPILSQFGQLPDITEDPRLLYQQAVDNCLAELDQDPDSNIAAALRCVLAHLDNRFSLLSSLLVKMLARREQWLDIVVSSRGQADLWDQLADNLQQVLADTLTDVKQQANEQEWAELAVLKDYAQAQYDLPLPQHWQDTDLQCWCNFANWLLTQTGQWRKSVNKRQGFIAKEKDMSAEQKLYVIEMKQQMQAFLSHCQQHKPAWLAALQRLQYFPIAGYAPEQAAVLSALLVCLPVCVAHLSVVFAEVHQVDFNEIAISALQALGRLDQPSDLALALDYQLRHILVDEFQDTAQIQYRLLYALTQGWQGDDGRTLFLVGDPMQSIYRFRQAEVGLFLQTAQTGLGEVQLTYLQLQSNFRSQPALIEWFNQYFDQVFPQYQDTLRGAVSYHSATAVKQGSGQVDWHLMVGNDQNEAEQVVACIQSIQQQHPSDSVAILVRSRQHLQYILPALTEAGLPVSAVELMTLAQFPIVQDLQALTLAVTDLADRLVWLAILRAPWCGLSLADLHTIAEASIDCTIWSCLIDTIERLTIDGQDRIQHFYQVMHFSIIEKGRLPLHRLVKQVWQQLGGPLCVSDAAQLSPIIDQFFDILQQYQRHSELTDRYRFQQQLQTERVTLSASADNPIQVMTIHKSKGLEFDHVILPALHKSTRADDPPLLLWQEYPCQHQLPKTLLAPLKSYAEDQQPVYQFLYAIERDKSVFESQRLLYVATTRARRSLNLFAQLQPGKVDYKLPTPRSFLALLWPVLKQDDQFEWPVQTFEAEDVVESEVPDARIWRLPTSILMSLRVPHFSSLQAPHLSSLRAEGAAIPAKENTNHPNPIIFNQEPIRIRGIIIHDYLARMASDGLVHWPTERIQQQERAIRNQFAQQGIAADQSCVQSVIMCLLNVLQDKRGRWILESHSQHWAERALWYSPASLIEKKHRHCEPKARQSTTDEGVLNQIIIDRCFVDQDDVLWIIDYKTALPTEGQPIEDFLAIEQVQHQKQLMHYGQVLSMRYPDKPIRYGLYFPMCQLWQEIKP